MIEAVALGLLYLTPAILLGLLLLAGRYPGEPLIVRLAARRRRPGARAPLRLSMSRPALRAVPPHGAVLAWSRAGRAPPAGA